MKIIFQEYEESRKYFNLNDIANGKFNTKAEFRVLTKNYDFYIKGVKFTILKGFWWDGASIPRACKSIAGGSWDRDISPGGLIHDILYNTQIFLRCFCDDVLFNVNKLNDMSFIKNHIIYHSVRIGGWVAWNDKELTHIDGCRKHLLINGMKCNDVLPLPGVFNFEDII